MEILFLILTTIKVINFNLKNTNSNKFGKNKNYKSNKKLINLNIKNNKILFTQVI